MKRFASIFLATGMFLVSLSAAAQNLTVSAAASLTNAFKEIAQAFEIKHPGSKLELNFAASGVLLQQIIQGAPADIFAAADQETMDRAQSEGIIKEASRTDFIGNSLVLITPIKNPLSFNTLGDLKNERIKYIAIGNPATTPNGRYARAVLQQAGLWADLEHKLVLAENVRQSLSYVGRGEVDAGFVFSTDAKQDKGKVNIALTLPTVKASATGKEWTASPITYPVAEVAERQHILASAFIAFTRSPEGQAILVKYGFVPVK